MIHLMILSTLVALRAVASPLTLPLDLTDDGRGQPVRSVEACRFDQSDLHHRLSPDLLNVGAGTVLRINDAPEVPVLRDAMTPEWERTTTLVAYAHGNDLVRRYQDLQELHFERGLFYQTDDHVAHLLSEGRGVTLKPGDLIVSIDDPALMKFIFSSPTVEFLVMSAEVIDGVSIYAPTAVRGVIPFEILRRSATTIYPTQYPTRAAQTKPKSGGRDRCEQNLSSRRR